MHTLAFVNQKGGCGKTTTAVHLSGALAQLEKRVLLVDLDPQAHATLALGCGVEDEPTVADVLLRDSLVEDAIQPVEGGLDLVPSKLELSEFEEQAERILHPEHRMREALSPVAAGYDFCILDCPPRTDGALAANALRACDTAVLVVETGTFALQGALRAVELLEELARAMPFAFRLRVLGTLFDPEARLAREILIGIHARFGERMYETAIQECRELREAAACSLPIQLYAPSSRAAELFESLAREVLAGVPSSPVALPRPGQPAAQHATWSEAGSGRPLPTRAASTPADPVPRR